jgi:lipopolysaccharide/colanic/teichoic acid biosynthesis glycosyltransferase
MLKRVFDVVSSFVGLLLLIPLLLAIGLFIKLASPGPVIYRATRVGRWGKPFTMFKFRTMVINADRVGPLVTSGDDPRVTRVGRVLRKTKLDELPTLWNVLLGDMSIVGPRPENPASAALYNDRQRKVFDVRPGITSLASIKYRHEEELLAGAANLDEMYFQIMQDKLRLELEYIQHSSLRSDLRIIISTIEAIFRSKDAHA